MSSRIDLFVFRLKKVFITTVQQRGATIIKARKLSSTLSTASAACDHIRDWVLGTPKGIWVSMGVYSDGSYGIPSGLIYSFPVTCEKGEWSIVQAAAAAAAIETESSSPEGTQTPPPPPPPPPPEEVRYVSVTKTLNLRVDGFENIDDVKDKFSKFEGIETNLQKLFFTEVGFKNEQKLYFERKDDGSNVHLNLHYGARLRVNIKVSWGATTTDDKLVFT